MTRDVQTTKVKEALQSAIAEMLGVPAYLWGSGNIDYAR